jgi:ribosomal-protein-alanine N-acetyltransferase
MAESLRITLAEVADAPAIALLSRDEVEQGLGWSWTPERVRRAIGAHDTNVVVARQGAQLAGFALMRYDTDSAHLLLFAVAPAMRRRGLARALLSWLEATLRVAGIGAIQLEVRASAHAARACYERLGFEPVNATSRYYRGRETALHLVKELAPAGD